MKGYFFTRTTYFLACDGRHECFYIVHKLSVN